MKFHFYFLWWISCYLLVLCLQLIWKCFMNEMLMFLREKTLANIYCYFFFYFFHLSFSFISFSLIHLFNMTGGENKTKKLVGQDKEISYRLLLWAKAIQLRENECNLLQSGIVWWETRTKAKTPFPHSPLFPGLTSFFYSDSHPDWCWGDLRNELCSQRKLEGPGTLPVLRMFFVQRMMRSCGVVVFCIPSC